jgi:GntR family transcriptional regulator, transcriptional repressor for pyruvate dehydrogenase complex
LRFARRIEPVLKPANKFTLHKDIMAQMIQAIQDKLWIPGSKLPGEQALATTFGVSRNCIREVLKALEYAGVLEAMPGHGTFLSANADKITTGTSAATALFEDSSYSDLMQIRRVLEGQAAYSAAERATPEDLEKLERILKGGEGESLDTIHDRFHEAVIDISGNRLLKRMLESLRKEIREQRQFHYKVLTDEDRLEHWNVLEAIKSQDPGKAWKAMLKHVDYFWKKPSQVKNAG